MSKPEFVKVVREVIPQDGIICHKPSRIKNKVKRLLDRANIASETIRGVGRKIGNYALIYEEKDNRLYVKFQKYEDSLAPQKKRKSKKKTMPILTGIHHTSKDYTTKTFALAIIESLPNDWTQKNADTHRWISVDVNFLLNTQHTVESASEYITNLSNELLPDVFERYFTLMFINEHYVIGIGPA